MGWSHRFGGIEFRVGRRELGHLHGSRLADLPFPVRVRAQLVAAGKAEPHHVVPQSGWVSRRIRGDHDIADVVALFRLNYERPWAISRSASFGPQGIGELDAAYRPSDREVAGDGGGEGEQQR
jgi:hypothetical protein